MLHRRLKYIASTPRATGNTSQRSTERRPNCGSSGPVLRNQLILERPMTDVQFTSVKEGPSCSRLGTFVGLSASANDLVDHHRDISRRGNCRDACVLFFFRERADSGITKKARTAANGSSDSDESWTGALWSR